MSKQVGIARQFGLGLLFVACVSVVSAQSLLVNLEAEGNPATRAKKAMAIAEAAFDDAHGFYAEGEINGGNAQLENMTNALNVAVTSLAAAHKWPLNKKAELRVAHLQRRLQGLIDDIALPQRGWAEYMERKLDEIHSLLLDQAIKK